MNVIFRLPCSKFSFKGIRSYNDKLIVDVKEESKVYEILKTYPEKLGLIYDYAGFPINVDLSVKTKKEIKVFMDDNGIEYNSGDTKSDLIQKITWRHKDVIENSKLR